MLLISLDPQSEVVDLALARMLTHRLCGFKVAWGLMVLISLRFVKSVRRVQQCESLVLVGWLR